MKANLSNGVVLLDNSGNLNIPGVYVTGSIAGISGTFVAGGVTITVTNGIITNIV